MKSWLSEDATSTENTPRPHALFQTKFDASNAAAVSKESHIELESHTVRPHHAKRASPTTKKLS